MKNSALLTIFLLILSPSLYADTQTTITNTKKTAEPVTKPQILSEIQSKEPRQSAVFERRIKRDTGQVYKQLFTALENNGYFVVFETNIGKNLSRFAQRWGDDYNKNKLESIRSMIFCNGWYANQVSNYDPKMLALCPMHITVTHKKGITSILYVRPSQIAVDSPAKKVAEELELDVVRIIKQIP